jgi:predicted SAM-dependent methyltransferase
VLRQSIKDIYFLLNQYAVLPNTWLARFAYNGKTGLKVHLGCGDDYRNGLINVDGNIRRRKDLWLDLRNGLPFSADSVQLLYCSHTLEHLFPEDALRLLGEIRRVLSKDGVARIAVPSFEHCLDIVAGARQSHWPRDFEYSRCQAINYLFCDGQHKYAYCFENLKEFAIHAGFTRVENISESYGVTMRDYGDIKLGGEPEGSLVVDLRVF